MISDDLVNSYHLLLCALDLVFTNALLCNARKELLNPTFKGTELCIAASSVDKKMFLLLTQPDLLLVSPSIQKLNSL